MQFLMNDIVNHCSGTHYLVREWKGFYSNSLKNYLYVTWCTYSDCLLVGIHFEALGCVERCQTHPWGAEPCQAPEMGKVMDFGFNRGGG